MANYEAAQQYLDQLEVWVQTLVEEKMSQIIDQLVKISFNSLEWDPVQNREISIRIFNIFTKLKKLFNIAFENTSLNKNRKEKTQYFNNLAAFYEHVSKETQVDPDLLAICETPGFPLTPSTSSPSSMTSQPSTANEEGISDYEQNDSNTTTTISSTSREQLSSVSRNNQLTSNQSTLPTSSDASLQQQSATIHGKELTSKGVSSTRRKQSFPNKVSSIPQKQSSSSSVVKPSTVTLPPPVRTVSEPRSMNEIDKSKKTNQTNNRIDLSSEIINNNNNKKHSTLVPRSSTPIILNRNNNNQSSLSTNRVQTPSDNTNRPLSSTSTSSQKSFLGVRSRPIQMTGNSRNNNNTNTQLENAHQLSKRTVEVDRSSRKESPRSETNSTRPGTSRKQPSTTSVTTSSTLNNKPTNHMNRLLPLPSTPYRTSAANSNINSPSNNNNNTTITGSPIINLTSPSSSSSAPLSVIFSNHAMSDLLQNINTSSKSSSSSCYDKNNNNNVRDQSNRDPRSSSFSNHTSSTTTNNRSTTRDEERGRKRSRSPERRNSLSSSSISGPPRQRLHSDSSQSRDSISSPTGTNLPTGLCLDWVLQTIANNNSRSSGSLGSVIPSETNQPTQVNPTNLSGNRVSLTSYGCTYPGCGLSFPDRNMLAKHRHEIHGFPMCSYCLKTFDDTTEVEIHHFREHPNLPPFRCPILGCTKVFVTKEDQTKHAATPH